MTAVTGADTRLAAELTVLAARVMELRWALGLVVTRLTDPGMPAFLGAETAGAAMSSLEELAEEIRFEARAASEGRL